MAIFRCYSTCSLLVFLLVLSHPLSTAVENSTAITTRYPAPPLDINRPPSVDYDYNGGEICVVLATSSTVAVIEAPDPGNGQNFSINLPLDVPLDVRQGQRPCILRNYAGGNCLTLVLFSTSMLPLGRFQAFLGPNATTINYGPLGFVTPDGTNTVTFSETQRNFHLIYRTMKNKESFTVCRNGTSVADFTFALLGSFENCIVGSIGGFSVPFVLDVHYMGLLSEVVGYQLIVTTATCSAPESDLFVVLDVQSPTVTTSTTIPPVTPVDTPPPPTPHPSTLLPIASIATSTSTTPTASILTTPTAQPTTSPPPGNSVALAAGIASAVVLLFVVGGIIIIVICVRTFRSNRMGNCHLAFVRSVSQRDGNNDADTLVKSGDSHSPAQQGTPEPHSKHIQDMIRGTEEMEMSHTQINLHPSDDENTSSVTHSPAETPTTTTTSGQYQPSPTEQSKVTPTTATEESEATPEKSGLSPNSSTSPSGGETVVDGDSGDGDGPGSVNAGPDSDSIHKLDLSTMADKTLGLSTMADEAGSSGGVTQSCSGEVGQVLENVHTESPDLANYNVDHKKRAYSAPHKDTKNSNEKLDSGAQSSKKKLQDGHSQGGKSQYIDEEDTPEDVEKATSKINQRPERARGGSLPSRKDFKEFQDTVNHGLQAMKELLERGKEDIKDAVKQQGAAIRDQQNENTAMLSVIANNTAATREGVAEVKNNQEEMRDHHYASKLEDDQGQADEDYEEQSEDCSYMNPHTH